MCPIARGRLFSVPQVQTLSVFTRGAQSVRWLTAERGLRGARWQRSPRRRKLLGLALALPHLQVRGETPRGLLSAGQPAASRAQAHDAALRPRLGVPFRPRGDQVPQASAPPAPGASLEARQRDTRLPVRAAVRSITTKLLACTLSRLPAGAFPSPELARGACHDLRVATMAPSAQNSDKIKVRREPHASLPSAGKGSPRPRLP